MLNLDCTRIVAPGQNSDTTAKQILTKILSVRQDSLIKIIYGDEQPGQVEKIDLAIGSFASTAGTCEDGVVGIINRKGVDDDVVIDISWMSYDAAFKAWFSSGLTSFQVPFQTSKTVKVVDNYSIATNCRVLQISESSNFGETVGSETIIHFFAIDDVSLQAILSIVEQKHDEEIGDSTSVTIFTWEEIEVLTSDVQGFKDLKIKQERKAVSAATEVEEKIVRFNKNLSEYEEVQN